jgi:lysyl-tRNA synthetase, class II
MTENIVDYKKTRNDDLEKFKKEGFEIYPHKFETGEYRQTTPIECKNKYNHIESETHCDEKVSIIGRVHSVRSSGKNLYFFDLFDEGNSMQIIVNRKFFYDGDNIFKNVCKILRTGDYVGIRGTIYKTKSGELSIMTRGMEILAPCLHMIPRKERTTQDNTKTNGLSNLETRYRQRYLDLIINDNVRNIFITRSKVIKYLRRFLEDRDFIEVETPILDIMAGGATAKPFCTFSNDYQIPMYMRVAPELYLKRLIIGGFNKVFEIGRQFRNESNDPTHNCEFTSCEFYQRNIDYIGLMDMTEELFRGMVFEITRNNYIESPQIGRKKINFGNNFERIDMIPALEKELGIEFPDPLEYYSEKARKFFDRICEENNIHCGIPRTTARLLDKLVGHYIEPKCINPTFIYGHPQVMSPLAKWDRNRPGLTERFELFIDGMEYANAYTELNDPQKQYECFMEQDNEKKQGDEEAQPIDMSFVIAMEHGLPPTGGWGCGIDRLCMLLSGPLLAHDSIREVILFPTMKPL